MSTSQQPDTPGLSVVILAAGQGTRMRSALPKVLHKIGGLTMLERVVQAATTLDADNIVVVYGHGGETVREQLAHLDVSWVEQAEQLGTGHAVQQAMPAIPDDHTVAILYGDVPLIKTATLRELLAGVGEQSIGLLTVSLERPFGYGRIVRDADGAVNCIVEEKDASDEQKQITEVNTGFVAAGAEHLKSWLSALGNDNAQGEYYLTDVIEMAVADRLQINTVAPLTTDEVMGVNDRIQLSRLERVLQMDQAEQLMRDGVTVMDPSRLDIRGEVDAAADVLIDVNVILEGKVKLGAGVRIGANCILRNVDIGAGSEILPNSLLEDSVVGCGARVGPFARLRPETTLADNTHVGNFVEIKKSLVGEGSKVNHLSYIGDTEIGVRVNVGAGTITCNYDGAFKHRTIIGDDVFVGSDTQLVAPVKIGSGATIGAGSTITHNVPAGKLTLCRSGQQLTIDNWQRPKKNK